MHEPADPLRTQLEELLSHALSIADQLGELIVGCHISAAQDAMDMRLEPWTAAEIEEVVRRAEHAGLGRQPSSS